MPRGLSAAYQEIFIFAHSFSCIGADGLRPQRHRDDKQRSRDRFRPRNRAQGLASAALGQRQIYGWSEPGRKGGWRRSVSTTAAQREAAGDDDVTVLGGSCRGREA